MREDELIHQRKRKEGRRRRKRRGRRNRMRGNWRRRLRIGFCPPRGS